MKILVDSGETDRQRQTETDRQTDRQTETETERDTDRQREIETESFERNHEARVHV